MFIETYLADEYGLEPRDSCTRLDVDLRGRVNVSYPNESVSLCESRSGKLSRIGLKGILSADFLRTLLERILGVALKGVLGVVLVGVTGEGVDELRGDGLRSLFFGKTLGEDLLVEMFLPLFLSEERRSVGWLRLRG